MLSVYTRHYPPCTQTDINHRKCRCPKWMNGTLPTGKFIRQSAKTCSWENAERKERMMETTTDPLNHEPGRGLRITIKAAVEAFLDDEKALQLRKTSTCQSETLLRKQLLTWSREQSLAFLDQLTTARLRAFRASWKTNELVRFVDPRCRPAGASAT